MNILRATAFANSVPADAYEQASAFIGALTGNVSATLNFRLIHDSDKSAAAIPLRGTLDQHWRSICYYNAQGYGAFVAINEFDGSGNELNNVTAIRAHFIDLDNLSATQNYLRAAQWLPAPSFAVHSSPKKYHVYWPVTPYSGNDRFTLIQRKLAQLFDGDKSIIDATRVMRLPGTMHCKNDRVMVTCHAFAGCDQSITVETLETALTVVNLTDHSGTRRELGDTELSAPSREQATNALNEIDPNNLSRAEWISVTSAFKQSGWRHANEQELYNIWCGWCSKYETNDPNENEKQWNSIRDTEIGWVSLHWQAYKRPYVDPAKLFGGVRHRLPPGAIEKRQNILTSLNELLERSQPRNWLIRRIIPGNAAGVMYGAPGTGKTFIAIDIAASVASGTLFNGNKTNSGPVVYVAGEGHSAISDRFNAWFTARCIKNGKENIHVSGTSVSFVDQAQFAALIAEIDVLPSPPKLIVIDTLFRATAGADVNDAQAMGGFWANVDLVKSRYGCTVLVVHHTGRLEQGRSFGSIVLLANADYEISISSDDHRHAIENTKQKDGEPFKLMYFELKKVHLGHYVYPDDGEIEIVTSCVPEFVGASETRQNDRETNEIINRDVPKSPSAKSEREVGGLLCAIYDQVLKHREIALTDTVHDIAIPKELLRKYYQEDRHNLNNGLNGLGTSKKRRPEIWITATKDGRYIPKRNLLQWARNNNYEDYDWLEIKNDDLNCII